MSFTISCCFFSVTVEFVGFVTTLARLCDGTVGESCKLRGFIFSVSTTVNYKEASDVDFKSEREILEST